MRGFSHDASTGASAQRNVAPAGLIAVNGLLIALIVVGCGTSARSEPPARAAATPQARVVEPQVEPPARWIDVATGRHFSCGARDDGRVFCWGSNAEGRAGLGDVPHSPEPRPIEIEDVTALTAGEAHVCALRREGRVSCWGRNRYGQLGDGTTEDRARPVVVDVRNVAELDAGHDHTCARTSEGEVWCWGRALMIGDGTDEQRNAPVRVRGVSDAVALSAGYSTSCAWNPAGEAKCWGFNTGGVVFEGRLGPESTPRRVLRGDPIEAITVGRAHVCFTRKSDHVTFCGGNGEHGALGDQNVPDDARCEREGDELVCTHREPPPPPPEDPSMPRPCCPHRARPVPPPTVRRYPLRTSWVWSAIRGDSMRASHERTCFLDRERSVTCFGQLSYGRDWGHRHREPVAGTAGTTRYDVHDEHGCAVSSEGALVCWGDGRSGALGDGALDLRMEARSIRMP